MPFGNLTSRGKKHNTAFGSSFLNNNNIKNGISQQHQQRHRIGGGLIGNNNNNNGNTYRTQYRTHRSLNDNHTYSNFRLIYRMVILIVTILLVVYIASNINYSSFATIASTFGFLHDVTNIKSNNNSPDNTVKQQPLQENPIKSNVEENLVPPRQHNVVENADVHDNHNDFHDEEQEVHNEERIHDQDNVQQDDPEEHPKYGNIADPEKEQFKDVPKREEEPDVVVVVKDKVRRRDTTPKDDDTDVIPKVESGLSAQNDPILTSPLGTDPIEEIAPHDEAVGSVPKTIPPKGFAFTTVEEFERHRTMSETALKNNNDASILRKIITAYIEPPLHDTVPNTGSRGDMSDQSDHGTPPDFVNPLPLRTHSPKDLRKIEYPNVQTCHDMPGKFPIDRGLQINDNGDVVVWNVGNIPTPPDFPEQEAPYCPVEMDPFLPWIHDVFPSQDGSRIEFIAQNKRRCRTGSMYTENVNRLTPQVALLQSVSVQVISDNKAQEIAPNLWHPNKTSTNANNDEDETDDTPRYRLVPYEWASPNGMYTRFICRFHMTTAIDGAASVTVKLGETLSEYPFNYEYISYRKNHESLLSPKGKDTLLFWTSNLHFSCPLPDNKALQHAIANGKTMLSDGTPTVHVDVVPIRTSVRYSEIHLPEVLIGPKDSVQDHIFDPIRAWGESNVIPRVEASGRWSNIPICLPPEVVDTQIVHTETDIDTFDTTKVTRKLVPNINELSTKPHYLVGCLWASAEFKTRGKVNGASTDTIDRLKEWIEFHLLVGFDHIYVYDNSGAHTNETSLKDALLLFPGKVTHIDWPSTVCNNNIPAHDSTGERSSQYAAENSCRTRYGPFTEWLASFDTDEYFVPMGEYTNLKDVLKDIGRKGTNILTLRSSRGRLRMDHSIVVGPNNDAVEKKSDSIFLEAYNCDSSGSPKPSWAERARKQIYRPDYVLYHYVHYSTVTKGYLQTYSEAKEKGETWYRQYREHSPSEITSDEISQAVMVHTKSLSRDMTFKFNTTCRLDHEKKWQECWVAFPWPSNTTDAKQDENGMAYNCYINKKVEDFWIPKLKEAIAQRKKAAKHS